MLKKLDFKKGFRIALPALPLAGIIAGSLLPLSIFGSQCLMLALLIWLQVFLILEIFLPRS